MRQKALQIPLPMQGSVGPHEKPSALVLGAVRLAAGIAAVAAGQRAVLKGEAVAGGLAHVQRGRILTATQHLRISITFASDVQLNPLCSYCYS